VEDAGEEAGALGIGRLGKGDAMNNKAWLAKAANQPMVSQIGACGAGVVAGWCGLECPHGGRSSSKA
jgi:hypothetical protein